MFFLPDNLYKQVQIAYSIPRNISLITVGQNDRFNLFPTDLHGPVNEDHYIISLRHEGKACQQVMKPAASCLHRCIAILIKLFMPGQKSYAGNKGQREFSF